MPFSLLQRMEDVPSNPSGGSGSPELEEAAVTALTALDTSSPPPSEAEADKLRKGIFKYSCQHYKRRCKLRAPCCGQVFPCRHCHNEAQAGDEKQHHELPRHSVKLVICSLCDTEQEVQQHCRQCGVCMGEYFCSVCNFFDDDTSKGQFHCDACGICRVGGRDAYFHCHKCGCCYALALKEQGHQCIEDAMRHDCPICLEHLFESTRDITVMQCGHTMHLHCFKEMRSHAKFSCPICLKTACDMKRAWALLEQEIEASPMPDDYKDKTVGVLCHDCGSISDVPFHILGQKCGGCGSYNTRRVRDFV